MTLISDLAELERRCRALAMLEAILSPDWEYRYYSFNQHWAPGQRMASMRDGCGDDWFLLFRDGRAFLKGFEKEAPRLIGAILPPELRDPAFSPEEITWWAWWDGSWRGDTASRHLAVLDGNPATYAAWASEYYETEVDPALVGEVYRGAALTEALVQGLNPEVTLASLREDCEETGYPG